MPKPAKPKPAILLVEDDPDDVFFMEQAFKKNGESDALRVVRDGEEAVSYLQGEGAHADRSLHPMPSLILLDLKLPRKSGLEVLEWCRRHPATRRIPVIVLTASQADADINRAYELGANSYLVKPIDSGAQQEMVRAVLEYWIGYNKVSGIAAYR
jgi:CheY-like chemotaxis protein